MILAEGGNAIEAMLAMAASIAAVYPHMNHIGGDGFWLIREPSGRVRALMGAGRAGSQATIQFYRDAGYEEIPPRGPLAALTVPGAVAAWMLARTQPKRREGGKLPLDVLLAPAIKHAREGYTVTRSQARLDRRKICRAGERGGLSARHFWSTARRRRQARASSRGNSPTRSNISPVPGWTTSIAATSAARSPPISSASARR